MAEAKKREKHFERSYSDKTGRIEILHDDEPVIAASITDVPETPAEGETPAQAALKGIAPATLVSAGMRYITDIMVGVGNAVLKAEGGTLEKAQAKMAETLKALQEGTFKFRAASGQGGLSIEEEQQIIAEALVSLKKAATVEEAATKVAAVYARTKVVTRKDKETGTEKQVTTRPDYNALKAVPQIKSALAQASKAENNLDELLAV